MMRHGRSSAEACNPWSARPLRRGQHFPPLAIPVGNVVWLGHRLWAEDQTGLDFLMERLVAVMQAEPGGATTTALS